MAKFNSTDNRGGRPLGAKSRLARKVFEDALKVWNEPSAEGASTNRGTAALRTLFFERPGDFVRIICSILPRDLIVEGAFSELSNDQIEQTLALVQRLQERASDDEDGAGDGARIGRVAGSA
jgi:hypothetical protein